MLLRKAFFAAAALAVCGAAADAAIVAYGDRTTFEALGTIAENYGFEDFGAGSYTSPGNPYTAHGVQYTSGNNLIVHAGEYGSATNVITYGSWSPMTGNVVLADVDLFGFDVGMGGRTDPLDIVIQTTLTSYSFLDQVAPNLTDGSAFFGFATTAGEAITGFSLASNGSGSFPGLDNVTLGFAVATVPLPAALPLLGGALCLLGFGGWRRRSAG